MQALSHGRLRPLVCRQSRTISALALALLLVLGSAPALSQATAAASGGVTPARVEVFGGYTYFRPFNSDINNVPYPAETPGGVASVTGYVNRYLGVQVEGTIIPQADDDNNCVYTAQGGPVVRYPAGRVVPFFHLLAGGAEVGGPRGQQCNVWGFGGTAGVGVDYVLPFLHNRLAIRPIQADFLYARIDNGPFNLLRNAGGVGDVTAVRLTAGLTLRFGAVGGAGFSRDETTLTCSADPSPAFAGDPMTVSANALNLRDSRFLEYRWSTSAGKVKGTDATEALDTKGLAPGTYNVAAHLVDTRHQHEVASCSAVFIIQSPLPPQVACAANRAAINSGAPVTVTTTATSPQGRPLKYSYATSAGIITGNGPTAQLSTVGTTPGTIAITCSAIDDKGREGSAQAFVVVATPVPPAAAAGTQALCSLSFARDARRPDRVDNEAKGCLDDIALTLNRDAASRLLIVGHHGARETVQDAANRVLNVSDYLTKEKGIDAARLDLRTSATPDKTVSTVLIPQGASVGEGAGATFDRASVRRVGQPYGMPGARRPATKRRRKKAVVKAASQ